jgi:hypothetical protein
MASDDEAWTEAKARASAANAWFIPPFIDLAVQQIVGNYLDGEKLTRWAASYGIPDDPANARTVGLVMAGNIPLVGFHDMICVFLSGHRQRFKCSSRDAILPAYLAEWLHREVPETKERIVQADMLKGCDAYIATGSDNSARYFEQYFARFPHIIRRNRTSVAILDGSETPAELSLLADDIQQYFGLGCRNVTQLLVPEGYDFVPLLAALRKYAYFTDEHKYRHNFDYNLTIQIMNNRFYMTNDAVLLTEDPSPFSPISQVNYRFHDGKDKLTGELDPEKIQCIVGKGHTPFGQAQSPALTDYPDGVDTMAFLAGL